MRRFLPVFIFGLIGLAFAFGLTRDPAKIDTVLIDKPFPSFALETLADPQTVETQAMLSGRVSLVNIFGSWCIACKIEHPILMNVARANGPQIIGINWRDTRPKAKAWLMQNGDPYTQIIYDPASVLAIKLGVVGAPETFITDKSGRIRYKHIGPISQQDWQDILSPIIEKLEAE